MQAVAKATEEKMSDPSKIKGWGIDADPENDPTYPMKVRDPEVDHAGYTWERPEQQPIDIEVLHSNERPNIAATFGKTIPPSGLSGMIRREAFKYSENSYGHWLPLMLADRVQVFEGLLQDFSRGKIPNIFGELGWKAEWKHNRAGLLTKIGIGAAIGFVAFSILRGRRSQRED